MGLQEGRGEKEVILECFPILKNVPAKHTLMYFMCQAGTWSSISAGRCCFLFQLLLCSDSDSAGTQLCLYVVLQIHVHTVNWKFIFILYLFLNQVSFTQLDAVTVTYLYEVQEALVTVSNLRRETMRSQKLGGISGDLTVQPPAQRTIQCQLDHVAQGLCQSSVENLQR